MKNYLLYYIHQVISRGRKISQIFKRKIKTTSNISYMNYKYYLTQPMQMIERRINMISVKTPQLINSSNTSSDHRLIRKDIEIPFSGY